jgi:hypothetical protein
MFIRWLRRYRGKQHDVRWTAVLAESFRVGGQPRQRHIATLGSVNLHVTSLAGGNFPTAQAGETCTFWQTASARLDRLGNRVSNDDRERIEAALVEKVRRPIAAEYLKQAEYAAILLGGVHWLSETKQRALKAGKAPRFCEPATDSP